MRLRAIKWQPFMNWRAYSDGKLFWVRSIFGFYLGYEDESE